MYKYLVNSLRSALPTAPEQLLAIPQSRSVLPKPSKEPAAAAAADWEVVTDATIGGGSNATLEFVEEDMWRVRGTVSKPAVGVRGFCAIRSPAWDPPLDLGEVECGRVCVCV